VPKVFSRLNTSLHFPFPFLGAVENGERPHRCWLTAFYPPFFPLQPDLFPFLLSDLCETFASVSVVFVLFLTSSKADASTRGPGIGSCQRPLIPCSRPQPRPPFPLTDFSDCRSFSVSSPFNLSSPPPLGINSRTQISNPMMRYLSFSSSTGTWYLFLQFLLPD